MQETITTGMPSIDKPWLKYYDEEKISEPLPECTIYEYIYENNKGNLSDTAIDYYGTKISYTNFFDKIKKAASSFYSMGIRSGDVVTIMSMHTPETFITMYSLNYIGAIANLVYMTLSGNEIVEIIKNTASKAFLFLDPAFERVVTVKDKIDCPIIMLSVAESMPIYLKAGYDLKAGKKKHSFMTWKDFLNSKECEVPLSVNHTAPAVIVYTSGTTGEPKGVVLSSDNLNAEVAQLRKTDRNYKRQETVLMILPPFIIFGASMSHLAFSTGVEIITCIQLDNDVIGKMFEKHKPNRYVAGPMYLEGILKHVKGDLSGCIEFTGGGDAITVEQENEINNFLKTHKSEARYMTGYGMSEVSAAVTINMKNANKQGSLGVPLPNTIVKIEDTDTGEELSYGEMGEICFSSPGIMQGYYKNKAATEETIKTDSTGLRWIHTGDLGCVDEDGFVFFKGRIKRIYMILGSDGFAYKLFPQRIEEFIEKQVGIESCAVIVKDDPIKLHLAYAFVTVSENVDNTEELLDKLEHSVKERLPEHLRPENIQIIDVMPVTPSGKIDYRSLEQDW